MFPTGLTEFSHIPDSQTDSYVKILKVLGKSMSEWVINWLVDLMARDSRHLAFLEMILTLCLQERFRQLLGPDHQRASPCATHGTMD